MKKILKYVLAAIGLLLFFFLLDDSGIGMKDRIKEAKSWAEK